ncbi:MAG: hypothetical protein H6719_26255 [Sandaracinaceae bacterium]|nr:hypothetical protein [Sandaracinaceae bacterium]
MNKRARLWLSGGVLLALCLACNASVGSPRAQVNCEGQGDHYACTVTHTSGGTGQVCWDIQATCANGTLATANSCVQLSPGQTITHNVPTSSFSNFTQCDAVSTLQIVDTTGT